MTLLCSRNLTQQPAFGGDDIAFPTFGLRTKARRLRWVTLSEQKWVILAERRGAVRKLSSFGRQFQGYQHDVFNMRESFECRTEPITPLIHGPARKTHGRIVRQTTEWSNQAADRASCGAISGDIASTPGFWQGAQPTG